MDSKIKRLTILAMLGIMVLVAAIIVVFNYERFVSTGSSAQAEQTEETGSALEEDGMVKGANLSAFLQDETFFDHEKSTYEKAMEDGTQAEDTGEVTLLATSVEKDIRIKVVDAQGRTVQGYPFTLSIGDLGNYQDTDEDGMIYISGVRPGEYEVDLMDTGEYACASPTLKVRVKAMVS